MAFPAVISLKNTIRRLLIPSPIVFVWSESPEYLERTDHELASLKVVIVASQRESRSISLSKRVMALEEELTEAAWKLEDVLEFHISTQIVSQSESHPTPSLFFIDLREIRKEFECFFSTAEKIKVAYKEDDDEAVVSSTIYFDVNTSQMVGLTDIFCKIRDVLVQNLPRGGIVSIIGMAGIGKTTLANKFFEDPLIKETFRRRIFVPVGLEPEVNFDSQFKRILQDILAQVKPGSDERLMEEVLKLDENFWASLLDWESLIVLDDVWDVQLLLHLRRRLPPNKPNGCTILVTTRQQMVGTLGKTFNMRFMNKEESWDLLRGRVFGEEACIPHQLEKAGRKIAENCEGLPLLLIAVADLLSDAGRTPEFWNMVAADKENHIFVDAYDQISEVLLPSYNYLPQDVKPCFLYLGVFPQDHQFRSSRLIKLWSAEEFIDLYCYGDSKGLLKAYFKRLVNENVVVVHKESDWRHGVEVYSLHSGFWHLCKKQARIIKFLRTYNRYADGLVEGMEGQRRLSIYKNVLFGIKHIYNSVASVSNARSLLCTGTYHQYQVPICFSLLNLLRVLDVLTIRFYVFPVEVLQLVLLRYLALTYNENLPPSISKLWNLQCLIVRPHMSIKFTLVESYLPVEIWGLQELQYLEIMGRNLPDLPHGAALQKLSTLLDVDAHCCTEGVLKGIPNLEKLRVQIELPLDSVEPLTCFDNIFHLRELQSFQCDIKNPKIVAPPPLSIFGSNLKKLTLRGFGYSWIELNKIARLPSLLVLKLKCYAFRGSKWETKEVFHKLKYLLIEDTDLVQWTSNIRSFLFLRFLTMKNCYKLQEIPYTLHLQEIKLVDCNPTVVTYAKQMEANGCEVSVSSSWDDGNLKP